MGQNPYLVGLLGGALIGLGAGALLVFSGRIAGISGILGGVLRPRRHDVLWRLLFLAGLLTGGLVLRGWYPEALPLEDALASRAGGWAVLVAAGLLVGFGTRMGNGCTSGHGVCGVSRLSGRSLIATLVFMIAGMLTVVIAGQVLGG